MPLSDKHQAMIAGSGISPRIAEERGYRTVEDPAELRALGFGPAQCSVPALLIPMYRPDGTLATHQIRPDNPRLSADGRELKYESPGGTKNILDIHPSRREDLADPDIPLLITEGVRKADAAATRGWPCIALAGVWSWRGTNAAGGKVAVPDWGDIALNGRDVYIAFDSDVIEKREVQRAAKALQHYLRGKSATVRYLLFPAQPDGSKTGLDDWFVNGGTDPLTLATDTLPGTQAAVAGLRSFSDAELAEYWLESQDAEAFRWFTDAKVWAAYNAGRWDQASGEGLASTSVGSMLRELEMGALERDDPKTATMLGSASKLSSVLNRARSIPASNAREQDFDQDPWLFGVVNGAIDLRTGELLPHTLEHYITRTAPTAYVPDAPRSQFEAFIQWALPDPEVREFVQQLLGQALVGQVNEHVLPVFTGSGANGKGTLIRAVMTTIGADFAVPGSRKLLIESKNEEHATIYASLYKKRLVTIEETARDAKLSTAVAKSLTGGDTIAARFMRGDEFSFRPTHTLIMITNNKPKIEEDEEAVWRRMRVVEFKQKVEVPDVHLDDKLAAEAEGILAWLVEGCLAWKAAGRLVEPLAVMTATTEYHVTQDPLMQFLNEEVTQTGKDGDRLSKRELHQRYADWCRENRPGTPVYDIRNIGAQVTKRTGLEWDNVKESRSRRESYLIGAAWSGDNGETTVKINSQTVVSTLTRAGDNGDNGDNDFGGKGSDLVIPLNRTAVQAETAPMPKTAVSLSPDGISPGRGGDNAQTDRCLPQTWDWAEITVCYPTTDPWEALQREVNRDR